MLVTKPDESNVTGMMCSNQGLHLLCQLRQQKSHCSRTSPGRPHPHVPVSRETTSQERRDRLEHRHSSHCLVPRQAAEAQRAPFVRDEVRVVRAEDGGDKDGVFVRWSSSRHQAELPDRDQI